VEVAASAGLVSHGSSALAFAVLASFRFVLELFVVEEELFAGGEDEIITAVDTLESLILEFHGASPYPTCETP
jgi:hypothetical protein